VRVDREDWNASTEDASLPPADTKIEVVSVSGTHLVVKVTD